MIVTTKFVPDSQREVMKELRTIARLLERKVRHSRAVCFCYKMRSSSIILLPFHYTSTNISEIYEYWVFSFVW